MNWLPNVSNQEEWTIIILVDNLIFIFLSILKSITDQHCKFRLSKVVIVIINFIKVVKLNPLSISYEETEAKSEACQAL
jgi:hypothetical protein